MGQQVSIAELKEQIEAAKRSLAEMSSVNIAAEPLFQPAALPNENFAGLASGQKDDALDALNQNLLANDDVATGEMATGEMATGEDFQFFRRPKRSDRGFSLSSPMSRPSAESLERDGDQRFFQALDRRLDRLEDDLGQSRRHIHELITLLSDLDMAAKPAKRNSASVKYLLRRNLYWFVIGLLVISWSALTPPGRYWINYFLSLI